METLEKDFTIEDLEDGSMLDTDNYLDITMDKCTYNCINACSQKCCKSKGVSEED